MAAVFVLDQHTGVLSVSGVDDLLDNYELTLRVTDGKYESECIVQVCSISYCTCRVSTWIFHL